MASLKIEPTLRRDLMDYGLSSAVISTIEDYSQFLSERDPGSEVVWTKVLADAERELAGQVRKLAPFSPAVAHQVGVIGQYLQSRPEPMTPHDVRLDSIIVTGVAGHDTTEDVVGPRITELAREQAQEHGLDYDSLSRSEKSRFKPPSIVVSQMMEDETGNMHQRLEAAIIAECAILGISDAQALNVLEDAMHVIVGLQRDQASTDFKRDGNNMLTYDNTGNPISVYPRYAMNIFVPTEYRGVKTTDEILLMRGIVKAVERAEQTPRMIPTRHPRFSDATNAAVDELQVETLDRLFEELSEAYASDRDSYVQRALRLMERHEQHEEIFVDQGLQLMRGPTRLQNCIKNLLILHNATLYIREKAEDGTLDSISPWLVETFTKMYERLAMASLEHVKFEKKHLVVYHGISPGYAANFEQRTDEYFETEDSTKRVPQYESPEWGYHNGMLDRHIGIMNKEVVPGDLDEHYLQFRDFVTLERVFNRFLENVNRDRKDWVTIEGDLT